MVYSVVRAISFVFISIWWIFFLIWLPGWSDFVARVSYTREPLLVTSETADLARHRALLYATQGGNRASDIFFSESEVSHLLDVHTIYRPLSLTLNLLAIISWGVLIVAIHQKKNLTQDLLLASRILLGLLSLCMLALVLFNSFFVVFHQILFPQGNWQFAQSSLLIQIFPESFWMGMIISIIMLLSTTSLLLWLLGKKK